MKTASKKLPKVAPMAPPKLKKPCAADIKFCESFFSILETKAFIAISVDPTNIPATNNETHKRI